MPSSGTDEVAASIAAVAPHAAHHEFGRHWLLVSQSGSLPPSSALEALEKALTHSLAYFDSAPPPEPTDSALSSILLEAQSSGSPSLCLFSVDLGAASSAIAEGLPGSLANSIADLIGSELAKSVGRGGSSFSVGADRFAFAYQSHAKADPELYSAQAIQSVRRRLGLPLSLPIPAGPFFSCVPGSPGADSGVRTYFDGL